MGMKSIYFQSVRYGVGGCEVGIFGAFDLDCFLGGHFAGVVGGRRV